MASETLLLHGFWVEHVSCLLFHFKRITKKTPCRSIAPWGTSTWGLEKASSSFSPSTTSSRSRTSRRTGSRSSGSRTQRRCPWWWWVTSVTSPPGRWTCSRPETWPGESYRVNRAASSSSFCSKELWNSLHWDLSQDQNGSGRRVLHSRQGNQKRCKLIV